MKAYLDILKNIIDNGVDKQPVRFDASGKPIPVENGTKGTFAEIFRHDMSDGFPLLTTKFVSIKNIAVELEGFLKGITDKKWFEDRNCFIWSAWNNPEIIESDYDEKKYRNEDRDLGPLGYSHQWRNFNKPYQPIPTIHTKFDKSIKINKDNTSKYIGQKFNNKYGEYIVIDSIRKNNQTHYKVKFIKTGYENIVSATNLKKQEVKDWYSPVYQNIACLGESYKNNPLDKKLRKTWYNIINRCYNKSNKDYNNYGQDGVYVDNRWLIYSNFLEDCPKILGWKEKLGDWNNYTLDKDYNGQNCYSLNNCRWITKKQQSRLRKDIYKFIAISPNKKEKIYTSIADCANENNLDSGSISRVINGKYKHHQGWTFKKIEKYKEETIDQLKTVVNKLKTNPYDRRMVVSGWNPNQMSQMALPSCHFAYNVVVYENKLNLTYVMRSQDFPIGGPYNIASYALLLKLLAKESGLIEGQLVGVLNDCHIYNNQLDGAKEQLLRTPGKLPTLTIPDDGWDGIFNWTHKDMVLENYNPNKEQIDFGNITV